MSIVPITPKYVSILTVECPLYYINCIFAEAWPSDIFPSDGHVAFCFVLDYKVVAFGWCVHRTEKGPMDTEYNRVGLCNAVGFNEL